MTRSFFTSFEPSRHTGVVRFFRSLLQQEKPAEIIAAPRFECRGSGAMTPRKHNMIGNFRSRMSRCGFCGAPTPRIGSRSSRIFAAHVERSIRNWSRCEGRIPGQAGGQRVITASGNIGATDRETFLADG